MTQTRIQNRSFEAEGDISLSYSSVFITVLSTKLVGISDGSLPDGQGKYDCLLYSEHTSILVNLCHLA